MFPQSRSAEQSVQTAASRRLSQTNIVDSGEVQVTVAALNLDVGMDAADCGPQTDNTLDAIEQLRQDMRIEMSLEIAKEVGEMGKTVSLVIAKEVGEMGKTMSLEIAKEVGDMGKTMRLEIAKEVGEMGKTMSLEIAKEVGEMGKTMSLEIAKEVGEMGTTMRQEIVDMVTAMLPKASNGNHDVTTSSRHQETRKSTPLWPKRKILPEITPEPADTGILGIVDVLISFKLCFPISYGIAVKYNQE